jgi:hypothetical protein
MIKSAHILIFALLSSLASLPLEAQSNIPKPNWNRPMALEAAGSIDTQAALKPLFQLAREGKDEQLLLALLAVEQRSGWPLPAREYLAHAFAVGLGDLPARAAGTEMLDYLLNYESRTLVPHDDQGMYGVPLFNVRAAAAGTRAKWERRSAAAEAEGLLEKDSQAWLDAWIDASPSRRKGYADALGYASPDKLSELGALSMQQAAKNSSLAEIAARTGLILGDLPLFSEAVSAGSGPWIVQAFRKASEKFSDDENFVLLQYSMERASPGTAALAMAELAPARLDQHAVADLMFQSLDNPKLGAAAALVLSKSRDPHVRERLKNVAASDNKLASQRAGIAIDTARDRSAGGEQ